MSAKHVKEGAHTSGSAIAALVIGVIALVSSWVPIINNFSFVLALIGVIIAVVGVVGTMRGKRTGRGLAIAALVVNLVAAGMVLATQSLYSAALDEVTSSSSSASSDDEDDDAEVQEADVDGDSEDSDTQEAEYLVTIDSATVTTDYSGNPAIVVEFTFTNNSDEATSYYLECSDKAFQNGVELDTAIVSGLESNYTTELKPGASVTVRRAYSLSDESDVTVEVEEWLSWEDTILAEATFSVA